MIPEILIIFGFIVIYTVLILRKISKTEEKLSKQINNLSDKLYSIQLHLDNLEEQSKKEKTHE